MQKGRLNKDCAIRQAGQICAILGPNIGTNVLAMQFDLNSKQTAKLLDKSAKTVLRWAKEGRLSYMTVRTPQRDYYRFNSAEVQDFLAAPVADPLPQQVQQAQPAASPLPPQPAPTKQSKPPLNTPSQPNQAILSKLEGNSHRLERLERILKEQFTARKTQFTGNQADATSFPTQQPQDQSSSAHYLNRTAELKADNLYLQNKLAQERSFAWILAILLFILLLELVIYWLN